MGFENVGRKWSPAELATYLATLQRPVWCQSITFHHTGVPTLVQRPNGFSVQSMRNTQNYYETPNAAARKGAWRSGPHLFIDEDECWGMTDFRQQGTHARSFNRNSIGIEVLGDYNTEDHNTGRGRACWTTATAAGRALLDWLGLEVNQMNIKFHRDDPRTTKTCPGTRIQKDWIVREIQIASAGARARS